MCAVHALVAFREAALDLQKSFECLAVKVLRLPD
jgi:hypothetical protein